MDRSVKLSRKTLVIEIDDEKHRVPYPSVKFMRDYRAKLKDEYKDLADDEALRILWVDLGLKEEVVDQLDYDHLVELSRSLDTSKKK